MKCLPRLSASFPAFFSGRSLPLALAATMLPLMSAETARAQFQPQPPRVAAQAPKPAAAPSGGQAAAGFRRAVAAQPPRPLGMPDPARVTIADTTPPPVAGGTSTGSAAPDPTTLTLDSIPVDAATKEQARSVALEFFGSKLEGQKAAAAVRKVLRLKWHKSLAAATRQATKEDRPILLVQALGDIAGFT